MDGSFGLRIPPYLAGLHTLAEAMACPARPSRHCPHPEFHVTVATRSVHHRRYLMLAFTVRIATVRPRHLGVKR